MSKSFRQCPYAGKLSLEKKLPMADALVYTVAVLHGATAYTQDAHFEGLAQVRYFAKAALHRAQTAPKCLTLPEIG